MERNYSIVIVGTGGQGVIRASSVIGHAVLNSDKDYKLRTAETHGMAQRGGSVIVHLRFGPDVESPLVKVNSADVLMSFELVESIRYIDYLKKDGVLLVNNEIIIPPVLFRGQHVDVDPQICIGCGNCKTNCYVNNNYYHSKSLAVIDQPASKISNGICRILSGCTGCKICIGTCSREAIKLVREIRYPSFDEINELIKQASKNNFIIHASELAKELGDIRMTNIVMIGAMIGLNVVPLNSDSIKQAIENVFNPKVVEMNIKALEAGIQLIKKIKKN